jgi:hypothetical protein
VQLHDTDRFQHKQPKAAPFSITRPILDLSQPAINQVSLPVTLQLHLEGEFLYQIAYSSAYED